METITVTPWKDTPNKHFGMSYKKYNRFARGSGCYTCIECGKRTRDTGEGASIKVCSKCFDRMQLENAHADGDHDQTPDPDCPDCKAQAVR